MDEFNTKRILTVYGLVTILFWISYSFYLPPVVITPEMKSLVSEARQFAPELDTTEELLTAQLIRSSRIAFAKSILMIITGVISGILIMRLKRWGRTLAVALCSVMLVIHFLKFVVRHGNIQESLYATYVQLMRQFPLRVIHLDIIAPLFFITTIIFLTRKSVSRAFDHRNA